MKDNLHLKLQELRKKNNLSQTDVAEHLHISRQAVSQWETGKYQPDIANIKKLCKLYNVSLNEMLGVEEEEKEEKVAEVHSKKEHNTRDLRPILEVLVIAILLAVASQIAVLGVILSIVTIVWALKQNVKAKKLVSIIGIVALIISVQCSYGLLSYYLSPDAGADAMKKLVVISVEVYAPYLK